MKCLMKYKWVKLQRNMLPQGKGIMGQWARLASRAAFRKGNAVYCGYENAVMPGMWAGGIVGLKSILGVRNRMEALQTLDELSRLGYIEYTLETDTKKLTYQITDWVVKCSGEECLDGAVYTTEGYGFLCLPRDITERLVRGNHIFDETDAWLDLWCHTVFEDQGNAFSFFAPAVQYGKYGVALTLETLGHRWNWEKTKVWRFLKKHGDVFSLYKLPGSYGCLIFNKAYPTGMEVSLPAQEEITRILGEIREMGKEEVKNSTDNGHINRLIVWHGRKLIEKITEPIHENRVAHSEHIIRAYISLCLNNQNCIFDCGSINNNRAAAVLDGDIRGPCSEAGISKAAKENLRYEDGTGQNDRLQITGRENPAPIGYFFRYPDETGSHHERDA